MLQQECSILANLGEKYIGFNVLFFQLSCRFENLKEEKERKQSYHPLPSWKCSISFLNSYYLATSRDITSDHFWECVFIPHKLLKGGGIAQFFLPLPCPMSSTESGCEYASCRKWVLVGWEMCHIHLWVWQTQSQGLGLQHQFWWEAYVSLLATQAAPNHSRLQPGLSKRDYWTKRVSNSAAVVPVFRLIVCKL